MRAVAFDLTCGSAASWYFDRRIHTSKSHNASISHVIYPAGAAGLGRRRGEWLTWSKLSVWEGAGVLRLSAAELARLSPAQPASAQLGPDHDAAVTGGPQHQRDHPRPALRRHGKAVRCRRAP